MSSPPRPLSIEIETAQTRHLIHVPPQRQHQPLADLLRQSHLPLNTRCGRRGLCDGCLVELVAGTLTSISGGKPVTATDRPLTLRGCEYRLSGEGNLKLRLPGRSLLGHQPEIVTDFRINVPRAHHPLLQIVLVQRASLAPGAIADQLARFIEIHCNTGRAVRLSASAAAQAEELAGSEQFFITIELHEDHWLIAHIDDAAPPSPLGAAIDVGTTTVAVLLVDLSTGDVLSRAAAFNEQMHLGDDVVTRITLCANDHAMVGRLQDAVAARTIVPLLREALAKAHAEPDRLQCLSVAGNTTMLHLLAGVNPAPMGVAPFTPVFLDHRIYPAEQILHDKAAGACAPDAQMHVLPGPAAYVGADLSAGVIASGLLYDDGPSLLVDVGTNGEIILKHNGKLFGCATAAGPAFEGAGLSCGIRAGEGAITHIGLSAAPFAIGTKWIDRTTGGKPIGLCGSAYVDFLSEARRIGLLTTTGRFDTATVPDASSRLVRTKRDDLSLRISVGQEGAEIGISERDIAALLQAKAAIAAGILTLLDRIGLRPDQIRRVYLAGGFGTHMDQTHAIGCGLLPGFAPAQVQAVGNTALAGAYLALLDSSIIDELSGIGRQMEIVELNLDPEFESRYIDQLQLPERT